MNEPVIWAAVPNLISDEESTCVDEDQVDFTYDGYPETEVFQCSFVSPIDHWKVLSVAKSRSSGILAPESRRTTSKLKC
jgi:hypothetical protein